MSPPNNTSSPGSAVNSSGERIDLSHEQAPGTEQRERDMKVDAPTTHIIIDSDDDVDVAESSTAPMSNGAIEQAQFPSHSGEAAGRDAPIIRELPYRTVPPTENSSPNAAGAAGSTYDTAIDISSSPPVPNRADRVACSPASLSRKVSQRSSYIGDDYPAPSRDPPAGAAISDVNMPQAQWLGGSPSGSHTSRRHSSRDTPEEPATHSGYSFPDMIPSYDGPNSGYSSHQRPASRRRPSSMINTHHSRALVDDLENMIYGRSPASTRGFQNGGSPHFDSDIGRAARRQSSDMYYPQARNRSFSARHSGESINAARPPGHQRYSSMSMPRWQPGDEGSSRNRRARGSLNSPSEAPRNTTLDDIFQDVSLPRWQPDAEVSSCPICGTIFSFWHRKHHCRKCGRVVCAACSPHRITIPRQYIVRPPEPTEPSLPPGSRSSPSSNVVDLTGDDTTNSRSILNPALGGGEEVRLCNPCVPDPNPNPLGYEPQRPHGHRSTHSLSSTMGNIWTPDNRSSRQGRLTVGANDRPSGLGGLRQEIQRSFQAPSPHQESQRSNSVYPIFNPPQPVQRPPPVSEQDICPICGSWFPPLDEEHPVETREAHIRQCIDGYGTSRESPASPGPGPAQQAPAQSSSITRMLAFTATEKDCLGDDNEVAECTICMEDYEVGQVLARLECLCKFHKDCIVNWFKMKAECPVHKVTY